MKCSSQKNSPLFQHISAVAVVNTVTILSRSIAFSFYLKHSLTIKKEEELTTLPRPLVCWGGDTPPQSHPIDAFGVSYQ